MTEAAEPRTVLVTGATGSVGRSLIDQLLETGHAVRAITRLPERAHLPAAVDVRGGDITAPLPEAVFTGVDAAFVFPVDGAEPFAATAAAAGVGHLVLLSSLAAALEHDRDRGSASQIHHARFEEAVRASGATWTILRPGTFANNLLTWAQPIKYTGGVSGPYPESAQAPIHEADVAVVAAYALTDDGAAGQSYPMTGPQALSRRKQLDTIGAAIGRSLTFTENSPEAFRDEMRRFGVQDDIVTMLLDYWRDTVTTPDVVRSTVEQVTGRSGHTLAEWAADHADDFR